MRRLPPALAPFRAASLLVASGLALTLAVGCEEGAPPDPEPEPEGPACETDLNYDADTAEDITLGEAKTGYLCPARDADLYRFVVGSDGSVVQVTLSLGTFLSPVEPVYSILNDDGTPTGITGRHPDRSQGEAVNFTAAHSMSAGTYLVRVADAEGFDENFDIDNEYSVTVEVTPNPDGNEPNDTPETATPITSGTPASGLIGTTADVDWYAIPVEATGQVLDVTVTAPADTGVQYIAEVYDQTGLNLIDTRPLRPVDGDDTSEAARIRVPANGAAGDHYYIRVHDDGDDDAVLETTLTFSVDASVFANPDANEGATGNDDGLTATTVADGASATGVLATRGDQDYFRVDPVSANHARVLLFTLAFDNLEADLQPQVRVFSFDQERTTASPQCNDDCSICLAADFGSACGVVRLQRLLDGNTYQGAVAVRRPNDPHYIVVNELFDDQFQEAGSYTLSVEIVDDPDARADDYLLPVQDSGQGRTDAQLTRQFQESRTRALNISDTFMPSCEYIPPLDDGGVAPVDDAGVADGGMVEPEMCLPTVAVPAPGPGGQVGHTVDCNGETYTSTARGRITYEGDRDFFRIDLPEAGYWGMTADYTVSSATPVELTVFFRSGSNGNLISSFLEAQQVGGNCQSSIECPDGATCIDGSCWQDTDSNPSINKSWPTAGECFYVHVNDERPIYIEVTDNGINDFDLDMEYTINVTARCGCPAECNGNFEACQGVAPPN